MPTYAIEYRYDDRDARRAELRAAHRAHLRDLAARGVLLASGPWAGPPLDGTALHAPDADEPDAAAGALLLVRAGSPSEAVAALDEDPFWLERLITARSVRAWDPVIGPWAEA
ncbi:hypothetical protein GXB85_02305 [Cellulomonas sp. APG4]|uniref:YciI family protein n=1 Tax=Cellulomonas sp. APG4 TaxID=1538656 RepID=UPI00137A6096|nr:YciI family protein [Cellulomonas sp. APG4]NCT89789.1 hypothetical protein [Cellulomonas sp. APG4]